MDSPHQRTTGTANLAQRETAVPIDILSILGPQGSLARRVPNYEVRPQQLQLAEAVASALNDRAHLVAEAGTGVGKSFAYLVPAILHATESQSDHASDEGGQEETESRSRRIVVSTHTISLQEQLINKDLPLLNAVIPREFTSVLVKGRGNYLSRRRFEMARSRATALLADEESAQLEKMRSWVAATTDGSLSSLPFRPLPAVWEEVSSDNVNCLGRKCQYYDQCFYYRARRRIHGAQILVVNHALFFTDLAVRAESGGFGILPDYDAAILDECHTIESVASSHLGIKVTNGQLQYTLNRLYNPYRERGLFVALEMRRACELVSRAHHLVDQLVFDLDAWMGTEPHTRRVREPEIVPNMLSPTLDQIRSLVENMADASEDASRRQELLGTASRLEALSGNLNAWFKQADDNLVYWLERVPTRRGDLRMEMHAAPIDVSEAIRTRLLQATPSVVMVSATVSTGRSGGFEFFQSRVGATGSRTIQLGSPFDYRRQAELILVDDMPDPSTDRQRYEAMLPKMLQRYLLRTSGRAFVLFTSYALLRKTAAAMQRWFADQNMALYSQADGTPRSQLLEQFKAQPRGALFGTDSFWQGVDVPGEALGNVIITKLPFSVPDHPLLQARLEQIRQSGGNPFRDYQIPEAVIKLRQGFGRLIRTATDQGIVVILDSRIRTKAYGRAFLDALPDCRITHESVRGT
ncbi:MAG: helicase [Planctomycetota bacterium]|nr:MAG: helicase [Planctomycetota bacterium]